VTTIGQDAVAVQVLAAWPNMTAKLAISLARPRAQQLAGVDQLTTASYGGRRTSGMCVT
jgi:hypothetical protein